MKRPISFSLRPKLESRIVGSALGLLVAALFVPVIHGCGGKAETVTETGNPSFVDRDRIELNGEDGEVRVEGSPGAVPGGAVVRVTNTSSEARNEMTAADDGSFEVRVPGDLEDGFSIEVENDGQERSFELSEPVTSCDGIYEQVAEGVQDIARNVDQACDNDGDCSFARVNVECYTGCWYDSKAISRVGQTEVDDRAAELDALCDEFAADNCKAPSPLSCPVALSPKEPFCEDGQCRLRDVDVCQSAPEQASVALDTAAADLDNACAADADCALQTADLSCLSGCYSAASSSSETGEWQTSVADIEQRICAPFVESACDGLQAPCTVSTLVSCNLGTGTCETGLDCEQRGTDLPAKLGEEWRASNGGCAEHADCVRVQLDTTCVLVANCGFPLAVNSSKAEAFKASYSGLRQACELFEEQQCSLPIIECGFVDPYLVPVCREATCEMGMLTDEECSPLAEEALKTLTDALQEASQGDLSCEQNEDCQLIAGGTECAASCSEYIVKMDSVAALNELRAEVTESTCTTLTEAGCEVPVQSPCLTIVNFPNGVGCVDGQCAAL